jgi:hypothetical protein
MDELWDEIDADLEGLRVHDVDPVRAERIRARCLAVLARRRPANLPRPDLRRAGFGWLEPVLALGLGGLYLLVMVANAIVALR